MTTPLDDQTEAKLARAFSGDDVRIAREFLECDCAENVAGWRMAGLPRLRAAVLRMSRGSITGLVDAIALAQTDVRDALVCACFGEDVHAHEGWWPDWDVEREGAPEGAD